jgi:hypothetical protein
VAAVEPERVLKIVEPLAACLVAAVHDPAVRLQQDGRPDEALAGPAAVWRERTGQAQELSIDLRQAVYGIAPWAHFLADYNIAAGTLPPGWLPPEWTWNPTLNGRLLQAPFMLGNPLGFQVFETKDGRLVTPTGIYPHHFIGFLALIGAGPDARQIAQRISTILMISTTGMLAPSFAARQDVGAPKRASNLMMAPLSDRQRWGINAGASLGHHARLSAPDVGSGLTQPPRRRAAPAQ